MDVRLPPGPPAIEIVLDAAPHPLTDDGRTVGPVTIPGGATVEELVDGRTEFRTVDTEVILNGETLPPERYAEPVPDGAIVHLRRRVRDGGFFRFLGTLLVLAAAIFVPPALGLTGFAANLASAAILVVGNLVVNSLFPVRQPEIGGAAQPDPTYSLTGGSNRARLYEPLPLVFGTHRIFPDLAAREYTENDGNDQYLYGLYHLGLGDLEVSELSHGGVALDDYSGVQTELSDDAGGIALVAGNVDTIAGAALGSTDWIERRATNTNRIALDFTGRLFKVDKRGRYQRNSVDVEIQWSRPGVAARTERRTLAHDDAGVYRTGFVFDLGGEPRDWTVRVRRTAAPADTERVYDEITWAALRAYQPDGGDYPGQVRLGVRIKASGQINGRLDRLSMLARQKIPVPNGAGEWQDGNVHSSNPAALFRWFAKGIWVEDPDVPGGMLLVAGVGLPDRRIPDDVLARWYAWCDAKGYRCDFVYYGGMNHADVLDQVATCGRAAVSWATGKCGVVWEDEATLPTGMVTPGNIVAGSFRVDWAATPPADEIVVRYIEPEANWQYIPVRRKRPGLVGTPQSTVTVTARGVTVRDNAAIECNLQAARQHYHRRTMSWEMGREGRALTKGSVVWITHSLIDAGIAGRVTGGGGADLTLDQDVDVAADGGWVLIRLPDRVLHSTEITQPGGAGRAIRLADPLPQSADGWTGSPVDLLFRVYDRLDPPRKARIKANEPQGATRFRLTAYDEVEAYHTLATSDLTVEFPDARGFRPRVISGTFSANRVPVGTGEMIELELALVVAGLWEGGIVRARSATSGYRIVDRLVGPTDLFAKWIVPPDTGQFVEVIPGSDLTPDGPVWTGGWMWDGGPPPEDVTNFAVAEGEGGLRVFSWVPPEARNADGLLIRMSNDGTTDWDDMTHLIRGTLNFSPLETQLPAAGTWRFTARVVNTAGVLSDGVSIVATLSEVDVVGQDGADGAGVEYIFASSEDGAAITGAANLPLATQNYDVDALRRAGGLVRGDQHYYDGTPPDLSPERPWYIRFRRTVPGTPAVNADIGSRPWAQERAVYAVGEDGRGVQSISRSGSTVTIAYTDGSRDRFTVADGMDGTTVTSVTTNANGDIVITWSDGASATIPKGAAGRGISTITRNSALDRVTVTFDDGSAAQNFELRDGEDGEDGMDGRGIDDVGFLDEIDFQYVNITEQRGSTPTNLVRNLTDTAVGPTQRGGVAGAVTVTRVSYTGATCFPAGTPVLMADGSWRPIEDVRIGERVRGRTRANTVELYDRVRLVNHATPLLFEINGGAYRTTDDHLHLTRRGWAVLNRANYTYAGQTLDCAMDAAMRPVELYCESIDPDRVGQLRHGDRLAYGTAGWKPLVSVRPIIEAAGDRIVYSLVLGGDGTMQIAGGYVVGGWVGDTKWARRLG